MNFKLLLVEDSLSDIETFKTTIERMNDSNKENEYSLEIASTIEEANTKLETSDYQGCVVDINLKGAENGNDVIASIMQDYRMPVIVFTGTPDVESNVKCFIKAEKTPEDVINELNEENKTGMFRVLGGKGAIEKNVTKVFWEALYPNIDVWKKHLKDGLDTEQILLRYTVAHLLEMLDENGPAYCTEEMYICGELTSPYKTGAIFRKKDSSVDYVLLSPPCDLAIREGEFDTNSFLLCEIESIAKDWDGIKNDHILNVIKNNKGENYHWLPDNELYKGGRMNFRNLVTCSKDVFLGEYEYINVKIQDQFVKSILNRFSAYYARQGQPDFSFEKEASDRKNRKAKSPK